MSTFATFDFYEVLQVKRNCSADELKLAYRKLSLLRHPDKNPDNPKATADFQLLNEAYQTLSDRRAREIWDIKWSARKRCKPPPPAAPRPSPAPRPKPPPPPPPRPTYTPGKKAPPPPPPRPPKPGPKFTPRPAPPPRPSYKAHCESESEAEPDPYDHFDDLDIEFDRPSKSCPHCDCKHCCGANPTKADPIGKQKKPEPELRLPKYRRVVKSRHSRSEAEEKKGCQHCGRAPEVRYRCHRKNAVGKIDQREEYNVDKFYDEQKRQQYRGRGNKNAGDDNDEEWIRGIRPDKIDKEQQKRAHIRKHFTVVDDDSTEHRKWFPKEWYIPEAQRPGQEWLPRSKFSRPEDACAPLLDISKEAKEKRRLLRMGMEAIRAPKGTYRKVPGAHDWASKLVKKQRNKRGAR